jgi:Cu+-exporting ATPase
MTCAACAARVEKKLNGIGGVVAAVNFATGQALITAPVPVPARRFVEAVGQAGYGAEGLAAADLGLALGNDGPELTEPQRQDALCQE